MQYDVDLSCNAVYAMKQPTLRVVEATGCHGFPERDMPLGRRTQQFVNAGTAQVSSDCCASRLTFCRRFRFGSRHLCSATVAAIFSGAFLAATSLAQTSAPCGPERLPVYLPHDLTAVRSVMPHIQNVALHQGDPRPYVSPPARQDAYDAENPNDPCGALFGFRPSGENGDGPLVWGTHMTSSGPRTCCSRAENIGRDDGYCIGLKPKCQANRHRWSGWKRTIGLRSLPSPA